MESKLCCVLTPWSSKSKECEYHRRQWRAGNLFGSKEAMEGWVPQETSQSAKWLKLIEKIGPVRRKTFYDSSMVSNLSTNKAKYVEHTDNGYILTEKGKNYLKTHNVTVNVSHWMKTNSGHARGQYGSNTL